MLHLDDHFAQPVMNVSQAQRRRTDWGGEAEKSAVYHFDFEATLSLLMFKGQYWSMGTAQSSAWDVVVETSLTLPGSAGAVEIVVSKMLKAIKQFVLFVRKMYVK